MAALFTRHPLALQTAYAEVKREASEQPAVPSGSPGSVGIRQVKDRPFYYRQFYDTRGRKAAEYLGPVGDRTAEDRAQAARERIAASTALSRELRMLGQQGYVRVDARTTALLGAMANGHLFRGGAVLVGSHAYAVAINDLGVRAASFRTEDIDIARGESLRLPEAVRFEEVLAASMVPLFPVPGLGQAPTTSFKARGADRLRVDLLVPARGRAVTTAPVPELDAHAMALPHLAYLLEETVGSVVLGRDAAVPVRVPRAERLAWHKMYVSQVRTATSEKRTKDLRQAATLVAALFEEAPDALEAAHGQLPVGVRRNAKAGATTVIRILRDAGYAPAAEATMELVS